MTTPETTARTVDEIVITCIHEDDGSTVGWEWRVEGIGETIVVGHAPSLSLCLDTMRQYLRQEGYVP